MRAVIAAAALALGGVGCGSGSTDVTIRTNLLHPNSTPSTPTPRHAAPSDGCLSNAPGGKLCGSDAKDFCQNMKVGQSVNPQTLDAQTVRECARLGVPGLRGP